MVFVADPNKNCHCFRNMLIKISGSPGLCAYVKTLVYCKRKKNVVW